MPVFRTLVLGAIFSVVFVVCDAKPSSADELLVPGVAAFLNVQEGMYPIDEEFRAAGEYSLFRPKSKDLMKTGQPAYQENVKYIKNKYPAFYDRFSNVAVSHVNDMSVKPFASLEDWAKMGDRVLTAFYAANTDKAADVKSKFQNMPPEAMAMINSIPEAKKAMEGAIGAMGTMADVSDHDKQVVRQFSKQIVWHMNKVKGIDGYAVSE